ncbi:RNA polymerase Rpb7 [Fimicolochytrium jonesii]|uniref:RNA polymerase Rpb7 n=1 Tax=Fimicolochytrium jonesii TaxID=1396493 RepID=UPI0022FE608D|nr:RNA polymerase Rpb7 [Fimicolochytrium jonesii]KAI8826871.1 RNA polymerase Rpb7 [Fimicolochytrium jonesii]
MFFLKYLHKTIRLPPSSFGPHMRSHVERRLYDEVEGKIDGRYGYIISVLQIVEIGAGVLQPMTGLAEFNVVYRALVMKVFKNMVVDGVVTVVNPLGFWVEVGPMTMFVASALIPSYFKYDPSANPPAFVSDFGDESGQASRIEKGIAIRARIIGIRTEATDIFCVGTIKEDYLGPQAGV